MKNSISSTIRQAILSKAFLITVLAVAAMMIVSSLEVSIKLLTTQGPLPYGAHTTLLATALKSDTITMTLPILCTLPFAGAFVDDYNSGFIRMYISRIDTKSYIISKAIGCVIAGGLCIVLGMLASHLISTVVFLPLEAVPGKGETISAFYVDTLYSMIMLFISGGFWSLVGMTIASYSESKYMAYASSFVIYYILIIIKERYFDSVYILYPKEWIIPSEAWTMGRAGVFIIVCELTLLFVLLFYGVAKRKIDNV